MIVLCMLCSSMVSGGSSSSVTSSAAARRSGATPMGAAMLELLNCTSVGDDDGGS